MLPRHGHPPRRLLLAAAAAAALAGCSAPSMVVKRPADERGNQAVTALWADEIRRTAQSGDWILSRSYSMTGDLIALATPGESLSHASIYDAERGTVIEALNPLVREVPLEHLLARNHHVIVVRPRGLDQEQRLASVARARAQVGTPFDFGGLVGAGDRERFYCSELVLWASQLEGTAGRLVTPSELIEHGEVIYFSGARDDAALVDTALARRRATGPARVAAAR
ncbi:MAG TPA: YiiX/YebB-like N1pC/P60 family cysteine hydrolase [Kofleriaceae bacterium]|nr:YiiX/YebB-like N1pC/P60 family cysteine hydrolase [Kofleriaceae bacterium]